MFTVLGQEIEFQETNLDIYLKPFLLKKMSVSVYFLLAPYKKYDEREKSWTKLEIYKIWWFGKFHLCDIFIAKGANSQKIAGRVSGGNSSRSHG